MLSVQEYDDDGPGGDPSEVGVGVPCDEGFIIEV